jgi:hypothetical protein
MLKEIFPSSCECDCGHQSHLSENTIKEMNAMSLKKKRLQYVCDSEDERHFIVFYQGKMVDKDCPHHRPQTDTSYLVQNSPDQIFINPGYRFREVL